MHGDDSADWLAVMNGTESAPQWIDTFRVILAECLEDQSPRLSTAARRLTISTRTLQRQLERAGTSWRAEVDAARRARAEGLFEDGASKTSAAQRLGYSDARSLRRAARRWRRS